MKRFFQRDPGRLAEGRGVASAVDSVRYDKVASTSRVDRQRVGGHTLGGFGMSDAGPAETLAGIRTLASPPFGSGKIDPLLTEGKTGAVYSSESEFREQWTR